MLIDHTAYVLCRNTAFYVPMRMIGRLTFPIICFLLVEGFYHTHDRGRYLLRMLLLALISEVPFDLAFQTEWYSQNVFLTLALGLLMIMTMDWLYKERKETTGQKVIAFAAEITLLIAVMGTAYLIRCDYSWLGILAIYLIYKFHWMGKEFLLTVVAVYFLVFGGGIEKYAAFSVILLWFYNGKLGKKNKVLQWSAYFFYPVHLLVLWGIRLLIN